MKTGFPSIDKTHLQGTPEGKLHPKIFTHIPMLQTFLTVNNEHLDEINEILELKPEEDQIWIKPTIKKDGFHISRIAILKIAKAKKLANYCSAKASQREDYPKKTS